MLWFPWSLPMRKALELAVTGDNITGEEAYRLGMANYCIDQDDINELTQVFAERIGLMNWQMATQYKRATKKAYEIQGIKPLWMDRRNMPITGSVSRTMPGICLKSFEKCH